MQVLVVARSQKQYLFVKNSTDSAHNCTASQLAYIIFFPETSLEFRILTWTKILLHVFDSIHPLVEVRELPRGISQIVGLLGVRGAPNQQPDHVHMTLLCGQVQRQVTLSIHEVHVSPVVDQHMHRIYETLPSGVVQHGETTDRVPYVWVCSRREKCVDQGGMAQLYHLHTVGRGIDTKTSGWCWIRNYLSSDCYRRSMKFIVWSSERD